MTEQAEIAETQVIGERERVSGDLVDRECARGVAHPAVAPIVQERVREFVTVSACSIGANACASPEPSGQHEHLAVPLPTTVMRVRCREGSAPPRWRLTSAAPTCRPRYAPSRARANRGRGGRSAIMLTTPLVTCESSSLRARRAARARNSACRAAPLQRGGNRVHQLEAGVPRVGAERRTLPAPCAAS